MIVEQFDVAKTEWEYFNDGREERQVRTVTLEDGTVLFAVCDLQDFILEVKNASDLLRQVDNRSKTELVLTFVEEYNPQRYNLVTVDGLTHMVFRARKCAVDRLDFIYWARERA